MLYGCIAVAINLVTATVHCFSDVEVRGVNSNIVFCFLRGGISLSSVKAGLDTSSTELDVPMFHTNDADGVERFPLMLVYSVG